MHASTKSSSARDRRGHNTPWYPRIEVHLASVLFEVVLDEFDWDLLRNDGKGEALGIYVVETTLL